MVEYFQLAHNVRHSETGSPVAEIVHNFGRADELNRDDLVRLCRSIARVCGLEVRDPLAALGETSERQETTALPKDVKLIRTLDLGVPFVTEALWERLGIGPTLRKVMAESRCDPEYEKALLAIWLWTSSSTTQRLPASPSTNRMRIRRTARDCASTAVLKTGPGVLRSWWLWP